MATTYLQKVQVVWRASACTYAKLIVHAYKLSTSLLMYEEIREVRINVNGKSMYLYISLRKTPGCKVRIVQSAPSSPQLQITVDNRNFLARQLYSDIYCAKHS